MVKIAHVHTCFRCPYFNIRRKFIAGKNPVDNEVLYIPRCIHYQVCNDYSVDGRELNLLVDIPDWCPLPDAPEVKS
jgi:hypothetical protein